MVPSAEPGTASLPLEGIRLPLIVRSRRSGDAIWTGNTKKNLKKLFNEWKVPDSVRWKIPICQDVRGVAAILGSLLGYKDLFRERGQSDNKTGALVFSMCKESR